MSVHLRHVAHVGHVGILSWLRLTPVGGSTIESNWMMMTPQKGCGVLFLGAEEAFSPRDSALFCEFLWDLDQSIRKVNHICLMFL